MKGADIYNICLHKLSADRAFKKMTNDERTKYQEGIFVGMFVATVFIFGVLFLIKYVL